MSLLVFVALFIAALTDPHFVEAQIKINEWQADLPSGQSEKDDEWVELINLGGESVSVLGYVLIDEKDNQLVVTEEHIRGQSIKVDPNSLIVIYRQGAAFSLNNDTDQIFLYESTAAAQPLDAVAYTSSSSTKSWGRHPDGVGEIISLSPSLGKPNQVPHTPTPQPTSVPTETPSPSETTQPKSQFIKTTPVTPQPSTQAKPQPTSLTPDTKEIDNPTTPKLKSTQPGSEILGLIDSNTEATYSQASHYQVGDTSLYRQSSTPEAHLDEASELSEKSIFPWWRLWIAAGVVSGLLTTYRVWLHISNATW